MPQTLTVEKPLTIEAIEPTCTDARHMMELLNQRLMDLTGSSGAAGFDLAGPTHGKSVFLLVRDELGQPVGCGALRPLEIAGNAPVAEIKRMYARWPARGIGAALLGRLEQAARAFGYRALWLETRRVNTRGCAFYRRHGYHDIPQYGPYVGRHEALCLGKRLPAIEGMKEDTSWT